MKHPGLEQKEVEKQKFKNSLLFPTFFITLIWLVWVIEWALGLDLYYLGIYPLEVKGLIGILTSPFVHGDFNHLFDNTFPLYFLSVAVFYFYRPIHLRVFFLSYILTGICVWLGARQAYHIGASGLVYGLASFLFFSGIIRSDIRLMAISLIVTFLYGSLVWGIFPLKPSVSWESHLWGAISGVILAFYYREHGPKRKTYEWEDEEEERDDGNDGPVLEIVYKKEGE